MSISLPNVNLTSQCQSHFPLSISLPIVNLTFQCYTCLLTFVVLFSVLLAAINMYSVKLATYLQNITTVTKLLAICIISFGGIYHLCAGNDAMDLFLIILHVIN